MAASPVTIRKRGASLASDTDGRNTKRGRTQGGGSAARGKAGQSRAPKEKDEDSKFWVKPGMNTFLHWLLNPDHLKRFDATGTTAGTLVGDLHDEIAHYINRNTGDKGKDNWKPWVRQDVKYNKQACETKYKKARDLMNKDGEGDEEAGTLMDRVYRICPKFEQFHTAYAGVVRVNPPPMVQTSTIPGEPGAVSDDGGESSNGDSSDESSDSDDGNSNDNGQGHEHVQVEGFDFDKLLEDEYNNGNVCPCS